MHNGYTYGRHSVAFKGTDAAKTRWRCNTRGIGCLAFVATVRDEIVTINDDHNHPPETKIRKMAPTRKRKRRSRCGDPGMNMVYNNS